VVVQLQLSVMKMKSALRNTLAPLSLCLAAALLPTATASCVDIPPPPAADLSQQVSDWRDEIIYQVLIDRFADGDLSNDYRVDRAAQARYHGGDWKGLEQKLDYVQALGVTTIWISPIVRNVETDAGIDSYHGYWSQDLEDLNRHFGNLADLRSLIDSAHARKMKVVLDIVTNHMGQLFYYDINRNGRPDENVGGLGGCDATGKCPGPPGSNNSNGSPVSHISEYDPDFQDPQVQSFTSLGPAGPAPIIFIEDAAINRQPPSSPILRNPEAYHRRGRIVTYDAHQTPLGDFPGGLKDLATERDDVRQYMIYAYGRWIELAGFDGFRIDTVKHVEHEFWQVFTAGIREKAKALGKTNFLMFGEVFDGDDALVGSYTQNAELDGLFDFPQYYQVIRDVFVDGKATTQLQGRINSRLKQWGTTPAPNGPGVAPVNMHVNFLDNHDVGRFLFNAQNAGRNDSQGALWNALTFLLTEDGIPCVYYGTEQEFAGGNDPANREDLFVGKSGAEVPRTDGMTFQKIARLTTLRKALPALRRGDMKISWVTDRVGAEPDAGIMSYERIIGGSAPDGSDGGYALVVLNTNSSHASETAYTDPATSKKSPMKVTLAAGTVLKDVLPASGGATYTVASDGTLDIQLPPTTAAILVPASVKL
jgi:alpha-amylase